MKDILILAGLFVGVVVIGLILSFTCGPKKEKVLTLNQQNGQQNDQQYDQQYDQQEHYPVYNQDAEEYDYEDQAYASQMNPPQKIYDRSSMQQQYASVDNKEDYQTYALNYDQSNIANNKSMVEFGTDPRYGDRPTPLGDASKVSDPRTYGLGVGQGLSNEFARYDYM